MMTAPELRDFIRENFTETAFRLETLQQYEVASDGNDFGRYLAGHPAPTPERKQPWLDRLRSERDRGLNRSRVRIVTRPVTDYTRFECEWGYAPNAEAGEDIRILDLGERAMPYGVHVQEDFWLIDGTYALFMRYDEDGAFVGAELDPTMVQIARKTRDALLPLAESFGSWWAAHSELHRAGRQVA